MTVLAAFVSLILSSAILLAGRRRALVAESNPSWASTPKNSGGRRPLSGRPSRGRMTCTTKVGSEEVPQPISPAVEVISTVEPAMNRRNPAPIPIAWLVLTDFPSEYDSPSEPQSEKRKSKGSP